MNLLEFCNSGTWNLFQSGQQKERVSFGIRVLVRRDKSLWQLTAQPTLPKINTVVGSFWIARSIYLVFLFQTLGSTVIDSSKKQGTAAPLKKEGRLLSLIEQEQSINLEVDPDQDFDYDKENATDPFAVSGFACDIFKYYQYREVSYFALVSFPLLSEVICCRGLFWTPAKVWPERSRHCRWLAG